MPRQKPPIEPESGLPEFRPKPKKPPAPRRGDKGLQVFVSFDENTALDALVAESGTSKGDYLRCLVRHAVRRRIVFDASGDVAEERRRVKKEG